MTDPDLGATTPGREPTSRAGFREPGIPTRLWESDMGAPTPLVSSMLEAMARPQS